MLTRDAAPTPMNLSTAIRLGAMLKPQAFDGEPGSASCALRAAAEAAGIKSDGAILNYYDLRKRWPFLNNRIDPRPSGVPLHCDDLMSVIYNLNDDQRWTRERIADYVAGLEAAQATERHSDADACCSPTSAPLSVRLRA